MGNRLTILPAGNNLQRVLWDRPDRVKRAIEIERERERDKEREKMDAYDKSSKCLPPSPSRTHCHVHVCSGCFPRVFNGSKRARALVLCVCVRFVLAANPFFDRIILELTLFATARPTERWQAGNDSRPTAGSPYADRHVMEGSLLLAPRPRGGSA